jgi:preprotein translocase subunit Sec63
MAKKGFLEGYKTYDTSNGHGNAQTWKDTFRKRMSKEEAQGIMDKQTKSNHEILGVHENATQAELKKAFRLLCMQWHPDKHPERAEEARQQTMLIIAAYRCLEKK